MIFAATHRQVLAGRKTATRRLMVRYPTELPPRPAPGIGHHPAPPAWPKKARAFGEDWKALSVKPGDVRAVQPGRGKNAIGHITITATRPSTLYAITGEEAIAEGFPSRAAFAHAWVGIHDASWARFTDNLFDNLLPGRLDDLAAQTGLTERALLHRLRYLQDAGAVTLGEHSHRWAAEENAARRARQHRFFDRHALKPVWVIEFELVADPAIMLAARPPRAIAREDDLRDIEHAGTLENRGYTLSPYQAISREGVDEAIDDVTAKRYEKDARSAERVRVEYETRNERQAMIDAINTLGARDDIGEAAARRLANMRRELKRLDADLRGAA